LFKKSLTVFVFISEMTYKLDDISLDGQTTHDVSVQISTTFSFKSTFKQSKNEKLTRIKNIFKP
jgi:hypothetical protein